MVKNQEILEKIVYMAFDSEEEMLQQYLVFWNEKTPVMLTGWNIEKFDIPYIYNRLKNVFGEATAKRLSPHRRTKVKVINNGFGEEQEIIQIGYIPHIRQRREEEKLFCRKKHPARR